MRLLKKDKITNTTISKQLSGAAREGGKQKKKVKIIWTYSKKKNKFVVKQVQ